MSAPKSLTLLYTVQALQKHLQESALSLADSAAAALDELLMPACMDC